MTVTISGEFAVGGRVERLVVEGDFADFVDADDLLVNEVGGVAGNGDTGKARLQDLFDADLRGERHEEHEDDEHDVDHRGYLEADVGVVRLDGEFHGKGAGRVTWTRRRRSRRRFRPARPPR